MQTPPSCIFIVNIRDGSEFKKGTNLSAPCAGRCADPEAVLEPPGNGGQVPGAAGTGGLSPLGLLGPVVLPDLGGGVAAGRALVLLDVHGAATATTAQNVRLVVALTETGGTLGC